MKIKDSSGVPESDSPVKWDYLVRIMPVPSADLISTFGAEGWELVSVLPFLEDRTRAVYHFKRRRD